MNIALIITTVIGLSLFEIVSSIDNAVINAEVLSTMSPKAKRWFVVWGFLFAVFIVRGLLPWGIVWATVPNIGPVQALIAPWGSNPGIQEAIAHAAPVLLLGGGIFLIFLFFHWFFLEPKMIGLKFEKFFQTKKTRFFWIMAVVLASIISIALEKGQILVYGALSGALLFFITNSLKENAEKAEKNIITTEHPLSDFSKILYLEIIDAMFSIDGVLGAFAFTLSVPLIFIGNGLGAFVLRKLTLGNIDRIKKYAYLKNGAMYSIFALGSIMIIDAFGIKVPEIVSPLITLIIIGYFFWKSRNVTSPQPFE